MNTTLRYGIVGYPVRHSYSPAMHAAAFAHYGIPASYVLFEKTPAELNDFLESLRVQDEIRGLNVTIPYKEKALAFAALDKESVYLRQVGALNTLSLSGGVWKGYNTDIAGFQRHLKELIDPRGKKVALLGAGGGARAVAYALACAQVAHVRIVDIDPAKCREVKKMVQGLFPSCDVTAVGSIADLEVASSDILINATPIGMKESDPILIEEHWLHSGQLVYDLIYNPAHTKLLARAQARGATIANGLKMLLYQGMCSFEIWTGRPAPQEAMQQALEEEMKKCLKQ